MTSINSYIKQWKKIAASSNGQIIVAIGNTGFVYKSSDSGATWAALEASGTREWRDIAISNDGSIIIASTASSHIFLSDDGGSTWQQKIIINENILYRYIGSLYITGDGIKIFATASSQISYTGSYYDSFMFVSQDMGLTWNKVLSNRIRSFTGQNNFAVSNSGLIILCMDHNTPSILISTNGGTSFQTYNSGIYFDRFSISDNLLVAGLSNSPQLSISTDNGNLFISRSTLPSSLNLSNMVTKGSTIITNSHVSTNGGVTWTQHSKIFNNIIVLQNNFIALYDDFYYEEIYTSVDGITWTLISDIKNTNNFKKIATSENGSYIALSTNDTIYISTNNGSSWSSSYLNTSNNVNFNILDIAINANGDTIVAMVTKHNLTTLSVMISYDYGSNWITRTLINSASIVEFFNIAISDDGYTIYASTAPILTSSLIGGIYKSIDRGNSWSRINTYSGIQNNGYMGGTIKISASGSNILILSKYSAYGNIIAWSTNSGQSWERTNATSNFDFNLLTMSNDGLICYRIENPSASTSDIFKTINGGRTWSKVYSFGSSYQVQSIATNFDGSILLVVAKQELYVSSDGGQTFRQIVLKPPTTDIDIPNIQFENAIISHSNLKSITYDIHGNVYKNVPCTGV